MARQQRESHEKKEQIAQSDPLMPQMAGETPRPAPYLNPVKISL